ncbi:transposase [Vibrio metschnikovii]|uniref:Transposase n=1 Tax=Vibrio metschnikovii TaxID=28172 RepID=A0A9X0RBX7_VIBME|nr:transposase [Vibrio metschnikovii]MBC5853197.1 transposase [Vibrio metschnikovii]
MAGAVFRISRFKPAFCFTHLGKFYCKPVFYSRSYCLVSCGGAPLEIVKQYLDQQEGFD